MKVKALSWKEAAIREHYTEMLILNNDKYHVLHIKEKREQHMC